MKKKIVLFVSLIFVLVGCAISNTPTSKVEDLFNKYLNTDSSRPRTFEELTSEEFLNYQQGKMKKEK